jgi:glycosyltransferase involved in cell wall biosynthesis
VKVAIIQSHIGVDGRSRVIGEIVVALNELGITPDIYTLATTAQRHGWLDTLMVGRSMRCEFPLTPRLPLVGRSAYESVVQNWSLRRVLGRYDLIVNVNDFTGFLPTGVRRVHYFQLPLRAAFSPAATYRQPSPGLLTSAARWIVRRLDGDILPDDIALANSRFTRDRVMQLWPDAPVEVIYPPVDVPSLDPDVQRDIDVVTLGDITPDEHQLEQVEIASALPRRRFVILGAVQSRIYAHRLERAVRERGLTNVTLVLDPPPRRVTNYLSRARVFLHTTELEPFGLTVAQAIAHGCIPVVHDSGGLVELVTDRSLRFKERGDLPLILRDVLSGRIPEPGYMYELRARIADLAPERFRARIKDALGSLTRAS